VVSFRKKKKRRRRRIDILARSHSLEGQKKYLGHARSPRQHYTITIIPKQNTPKSTPTK
jgi:hypothetical protein